MAEKSLKQHYCYVVEKQNDLGLAYDQKLASPTTLLTQGTILLITGQCPIKVIQKLLF